MSTDQAWVGRRSCGCPTFAAMRTKKRYDQPRIPDGRWKAGKIGGRWVDSGDMLDMRLVPADQAQVVLCTC